MKLQRLESRLWDVTAVLDESDEDISCPLVDFLAGLGKQHEGSVSGLFDFFGRFAVSGRDTFNDELCHYVDKDEKIWEFIKGDIRVLWFYGNGSRIIICSHAFIKKGRKTPKKEVDRAISAKKVYEKSVKKGCIEIIEESDAD
jgi:hypothetical protein